MAIKLSEYAKENKLSYRSAWRAFKNGKLKNARKLPSGSIVVDEEDIRERELKELVNQIKILNERLRSIKDRLNLFSKEFEEVKTRVEKELEK